MTNDNDQQPKRLPNNPATPADGADAADAIAAEIALLQSHNEDEERRLIRFFGTLEPCQVPKLLRLKSALRARYNLTEREGLYLATWHYQRRRARYLHGEALVAYREQRERGRAGSLRARLMSCRAEIVAMHNDGMSYSAICHELKRRHEKLFRGHKIDPHYLARIMRTAACGGDGKDGKAKKMGLSHESIFVRIAPFSLTSITVI